jgi:hypothetical protein
MEQPRLRNVAIVDFRETFKPTDISDTEHAVANRQCDQNCKLSVKGGRHVYFCSAWWPIKLFIAAAASEKKN